jgi:trk system potassium uptake protein TrkH
MREPGKSGAGYILGRYRMMSAGVGLIVRLVSWLFFIPAGFELVFSDTPQWISVGSFVGLGISGLLLGTFFWWIRKPGPFDFSFPEAGVVVLFSWLMVFLISALPFVLILHLPLTLAIFEAVSGWTTTGLSILDVEKTSETILLWRSVMQYAGGAGLVIILLSFFGHSGGASLSSAEGHGDQLVPHAQRSARLVLILYGGYLVFGTLGCHLAGMSWFDAVNHAMAALSTGGFSTKTASIGFWDNPQLEAVLIVLMLLGSLNFLTAYAFFQGRFRSFWGSSEVRMQTLLIPLAAGLLFFFTSWQLYPGLNKSLRVASFEVVSALTTTGFSTVPYQPWNDSGVTILIVLMIIGGGACSTAGGMKQFRIMVLIDMVRMEIRRILWPRRALVLQTRFDGVRDVPLSSQTLIQVSSFFFLYLATLMLGTWVMVMYGFPLRDSLFEFSSSLGTAGLSVGITGPGLPYPVLWCQIFAMFLGRLEFFIVLGALGKFGTDVVSCWGNFRSKKMGGYSQ